MFFIVLIALSTPLIWQKVASTICLHTLHSTDTYKTPYRVVYSACQQDASLCSRAVAVTGSVQRLAFRSISTICPVVKRVKYSLSLKSTHSRRTQTSAMADKFCCPIKFDLVPRTIPV